MLACKLPAITRCPGRTQIGPRGIAQRRRSLVAAVVVFAAEEEVSTLDAIGRSP